MKTARLLVSGVLLLLMGCTTVQTNSFGVAPVSNTSGHADQQAAVGGIQVLYSEPHHDYDTLGTFSVRKYKPGFSDPTISDAIPELQQAAGQLGANAVIVRHAQSNGARLITIEGEAIRWRR